MFAQTSKKKTYPPHGVGIFFTEQEGEEVGLKVEEPGGGEVHSEGCSPAATPHLCP